MNLFQLEYFITLAETLSYTKASQKLHITQPTLSKLIINLEHMIGAQLFVRNKRDVRLTAAGMVFYNEVKKTVSSYENAIEKVRDMEKGTTGVINLGFLGTALLHVLPQIINQFQQQHPSIVINPLDYGYSRIMDALNENQIDAAILPDLELDTHMKLEKQLILEDEMCLVVHADHKYANRKSIDLTLVKDEPMINMNTKYSIRDHNLINRICIENGFVPNTVYEANTLINMLVMVDCKVGLTILAGHMRHFATDTIRFIPIEGFSDTFKVVCVNTSNANPHIAKLHEVIHECFPPTKSN